MKLKTEHIIILVLIGIIIFMRECNCGKTCQQTADTVRTTDTVWDTARIVQVLPVPKPYTVIEPGDTIWIPADTAEAMAFLREKLKDYYRIRLYQDTLKDDTSAFVMLNDCVTINRLGERTLTFINRRPTAINTTIIQPAATPRNRIFVGPSVGRNPDQFGLGGSVMLVTKKDHAYSYMYDVTNKDHYLSLFWKIRVKAQKIKH